MASHSAAQVRLTVAGLSVLSAYTIATAMHPALRFSWYSPSARVGAEVLGFCIALFAVLALLLPDDGDIPATRNAFAVSLLMLGVCNLLFGVMPLLADASVVPRGAYSFWPWLTARYLAGVLFISASLRRPRVELRWYLLAVAAVLAVVVATMYTLRDDLPLPFAELALTPAGVVVAVSTPAQYLFITIVPGALFGVGAWLAFRSRRQGASVLYHWVAVALCVQVLAKSHETLYPTVLGPEITSADLLRTIFFAVLLAGALVKVRQVVTDRGRAIEALSGDMRTQQETLRAVQGFAEREQAFRSVVVHELATPIATLRTFAHVLASRHDGDGDDARRAHAAEGVRAESRRLQELILRMEELRALELDEFHVDLRPVRLRPLLEDAAVYLRGLPGGHEPLLTWECEDVRVQADPIRLGQALRNIVTNAARYSPEKMPVRLGCRTADDGWVEIDVIDQGPGIPESERERVVRKFERGSTGTGEGAGLGLYVAVRLVESHGGHLELSDAPGDAGARVLLRLRSHADSSRPGAA